LCLLELRRLAAWWATTRSRTMRHSTLGSRPKDSAPASQLLPLLRGRSRRLHATW